MKGYATRRSRPFSGHLLVALLLGLLASSFLRADEPSNLPEVLKRCQAAVARLRYVQYTVKGTPIDEIDHPRLEMTWREEGSKLGYHFLQWKDEGALNFQADYAYDGVRSMNSWYGNGVCYTRTTPRPFDDWLKNVMFITTPFNFLLQTEGVPAWKRPNIELLQDPQTWARLSKDAVVLGPRTYRGRECMVARIDRCIPIWVGLNAHYVVYFDLKTAMPVAWKLYDEHDRLLEDNNVVSEQEVVVNGQETYVAPRQIREDFYTYDFDRRTTNRTQSWVFDFSDIHTEKPSDETFGLLATVRQLYDEDAKVWVHQPPR